ncbi:hypothetical protein FI667_g17682, partial [Globisporangium splendens]
MPLAEESQELFSFMTEDAVYIPTRVPQGAVDSALHFQTQMQEVFGDILYDSVLIWIDDIALYATDDETYLLKLEEFFQILHERNLKLSATKCSLLQRAITWCGKIIDGDGVQHDSDLIQALRSLPLPTTAADLQYLLCATNWVRDSLVDYVRVVAPLQQLLDLVLANKSRKKRHAESIILGWDLDASVSYHALIDLLASSTKLAFPDTTATICLCTDASNLGWAVVVTQVKNWDLNAPMHKQAHELLICKGGTFKGAQINWSIVEKEAYPIIKACTDLEYLLQRQNGFKIFCDHANLIKIFCPSMELKQHIRGKLPRWAMRLTGYRYDIEHINGSDNLWADIVSRWGPGQVAAAAVNVKRLTKRSNSKVSTLRPLQSEHFEWPSRAEVIGTQRRYVSSVNGATESADGALLVEGKLWIPTKAVGLLERILVVAHCGIQSHRGEQVMTNQLQRSFAIENVARRVKHLVRACLLCKHVKGGVVIQRPWDEPQAIPARNEVLHMDLLFMGDTYGPTHYVLVLKDELTHYCELVACDSATSEVAAAAILDWAKRFGMPKTWVSDNGTHFKNQILECLRARVGAKHRFTPVYTPWINGTVERLNHDLLQAKRMLLLELKLDTKNWEFLLPVVQHNLNNSPVASLANKAPIKLFTGLEVSTPLESLLTPDGTASASSLKTHDLANIEDSLAKLRHGLQEMHAEVCDKKERKRLYQMAMKQGQVCNFAQGDFVLWSRVDARLDGNKLMVRWLGPFRVAAVLQHSFLIHHLLTGDEFDVHGSRLKFYSDPSLNVDEELLEHVSLQGLTLGVSAIVDHRRNANSRKWELLVSWQGLQSIEDSWEPFTSIFRDVPAKAREYAETKDAQDLIRQMSK